MSSFHKINVQYENKSRSFAALRMTSTLVTSGVSVLQTHRNKENKNPPRPAPSAVLICSLVAEVFQDGLRLAASDYGGEGRYIRIFHRLQAAKMLQQAAGGAGAHTRNLQ